MDVIEKIKQLNGERGSENRKNGEAFEFRILRYYKKRSDVMFAIRSAGSHSAIDLVIQFKRGIQYWITCKKNGYLTPQENAVLQRLHANKPQNVKVKLAYYINFKKWKIRTV